MLFRSLFALFRRANGLGRWDLVVSAPWLESGNLKVRVDPIGFGPLALGLGGGAHAGRIGHRDRDLSLMEDLDHGAFIAPSGFTHHLHAGYCLQLSDQLEEALGSVAELTLLTLQMKLQGGFATSTPA